MCGRYSLTTAPEALRRLFNFLNRPNLAPNHNIAPTQTAAVVRPLGREGEPGARELVLMRWGLLPFWAKALSEGAKFINARAETVATKPAFRSAFRHRRCLVPADGFYEWRTENGRKQPYRIDLNGGEPFAFAGLWERWTAPPESGPLAGETVDSYTIITTDANEKLRPLHPRMPVIVDPGDYEAWLAAAPAEALALLRPYAAAATAYYPVDPAINNPNAPQAAGDAPQFPGW